MVVENSEAIESYIKNQHKNVKDVNNSIRADFDGLAFKAGRIAGKNTQLNQGLSEQSVNQQFLLQ